MDYHFFGTKLFWNHFINYLFRYVLTHFFIINTGIVLGGNNNGLYTNGFIIFISNRYLRFAIGS